MIALNILNAYTHDYKVIVFLFACGSSWTFLFTFLIYILEAGPSEVADYCDRNTYALK